jgi:O-antigen ligase
VTPTRLLVLVLGLAMAVRVAVKVILDPGLTGRMTMWPEFFSLARRFLTFGGGSELIDSAKASGELPPWANQGHNLLLDTLVRYGVVGLVIALVFIGLAFVLTVRVFGREIAIGFALLATLMTSCMGDLGFEWNYPSEALSVMLIAVLVSQLDAPKLLAGGNHAVNT